MCRYNIYILSDGITNQDQETFVNSTKRDSFIVKSLTTLINVANKYKYDACQSIKTTILKSSESSRELQKLFPNFKFPLFFFFSQIQIPSFRNSKSTPNSVRQKSKAKLTLDSCFSRNISFSFTFNLRYQFKLCSAKLHPLSDKVSGFRFCFSSRRIFFQGFIAFFSFSGDWKIWAKKKDQEDAHKGDLFGRFQIIRDEDGGVWFRSPFQCDNGSEWIREIQYSRLHLFRSGYH